MVEALGWGLLAQSSLLVAGLLVCWVTVPTKVVGVLGGFGAGAMIAAVSFDLLPEGQAHIEPWQTGLWMTVGVAVFLVADQIVERRFGSAGAGGAMGIVVGSVVDGSRLRPRLTSRRADGARKDSAGSGCSSPSPADSPPRSATWGPTHRGPCRVTPRGP
jgi:zinc transporter ZupT